MKSYNVGTAIVSLRMLRGKSQAEICAAANIQQSQLSKIEKSKKGDDNKNVNVTLHTLEKIVTALEIESLSEFFQYAEAIPSSPTGDLLQIAVNMLQKVEKMKGSEKAA